MTSSDYVKLLSTVALGACAFLLIWKGDVAHALTFGALLVPSVGQIPIPSAIDNASVKP
jgi:hypothetical protein